MGWGFVWMMVVLKIPIVMLLWLVYWAVKQTDAELELPSEGGGSDRDPGRHPHRGGPHRPRPPRRGPHAEPAPRAPSRVRAAGRQLARPLR